jgi:hypothetical protein
VAEGVKEAVGQALTVLQCEADLETLLQALTERLPLPVEGSEGEAEGVPLRQPVALLE